MARYFGSTNFRDCFCMKSSSATTLSSMSAWQQRGLRCKDPSAYVRPKKPIEQYTTQDASDFLDWYAATSAEREAQSNTFYMTAVICLGAGLLAAPFALLVCSFFR